MGVYIKGMEMPKENDYTIAIVYGDGVVTEYHEDYWIRGTEGEKQLGTAVPVPPHGRLGDLDEIERYKERLVVDADKIKKGIRYVVDTKYIKEAPTIIPAEEEGHA